MKISAEESLGQYESGSIHHGVGKCVKHLETTGSNLNREG